MTAASPLRGPKSIEGGGCAAAHLRGAPRKATGPLLRPPGRCAFPAEMAFRPPWTPETSAAPGARKSGQAQACPWPGARRAGSRGGQQYPDASERSELAFDNTTRRKNYTNPGQVTSSQQSHLARLCHTKPGVHETRDAPSEPIMPAAGKGRSHPLDLQTKRCSFCGGTIPSVRSVGNAQNGPIWVATIQTGL